MLLAFFFWLVAFLALAGTFFGFDLVLNTISTAIVFGIGIVAVIAVVALAATIGWLVVRDAAGEIETARQEGRPWRWQCIGWIGVAGILVDGAIGAWNVYQQHVLFSTAVREIPFAGVPVLLALASYPLKFAEAIFMKKSQRWRSDF